MVDTLSLNNAGGAFQTPDGAIRYFTENSPVDWEEDNKPLRDLAGRDNAIAAKLNELLAEYNDATFDLETLAEFLSVSFNTDGTLQESAFPADEVGYVNTDEIQGVLSNLFGDVRSDKGPSGVLQHRPVGFASFESGDEGALEPHPLSSNVWMGPFDVRVLGQHLRIDGVGSSEGSNLIQLPASPTEGVRQDVVFLEAWREIAHPKKLNYSTGVNTTSGSQVVILDDVNYVTDGIALYDVIEIDEQYYRIARLQLVGANTRLETTRPVHLTQSDASAVVRASAPHFYPYGNTQYEGSRGTVNSSLGEFEYEPGGTRMYLDATHEDVRHTAFLDEYSNWYQWRYRIRIFEKIDPNRTDALPTARGHGVYLANTLNGSAPIAPQGGLSEPRVADAADGFINTASDIGAFIGGRVSGTRALPFGESGSVVAIPLFFVHRRNQQTWGIDEINGGVDRPDDKTYGRTEVSDILDMRSLVADLDAEEILSRTMNELFLSKAGMQWEEVINNPTAIIGADRSTYIFGTEILKGDGIKTSAFDLSYDFERITKSANGGDVSPDGLRYVWDDAESIFPIYLVIPNEGADGVTPTRMFSYTSSTHTLSCDATDFAAFTDENSIRFDGLAPSLTWENGDPVNVVWSQLSTNTISGVIQSADEGDAKGYLTNAGQSILGAVPVRMSSGGSLLSRTPVESFIRATQLFTNGVQVVPNNGLGYAPIGSFETRRVDTRILRGPSINTQIANPFVMRDESSVWHLYGDLQDSGNPLQRNIVHATSADGVSWSGLSTVISNAQNPHVAQVSGTFVLHCEASDSIVHYTSGDGSTFVSGGGGVGLGDSGQPFDAEGVSAPSYLYDGSFHHIWYVGKEDDETYNVCHARSTDGVTWESFEKSFEVGVVGRLDTGTVYDLFVMKDGDLFKMWYTCGTPLTEGSATGVQYAVGVDGVNFAAHEEFVDEMFSVNQTEDDLGASSLSVIKSNTAYFAFLYDVSTGATHSCVMGTSDNDNVDTSSGHVSSHTGPINTAISDLDALVVWYTTRSHQNIKRGAAAGPLEIITHFVPQNAIVTTLGTGASAAKELKPEARNWYQYFSPSAHDNAFMRELASISEFESGALPNPFFGNTPWRFVSPEGLPTTNDLYVTGRKMRFNVGEFSDYGYAVLSLNDEEVFLAYRDQDVVGGHSMVILPFVGELVQDGNGTGELVVCAWVCADRSTSPSGFENGMLLMLRPSGRVLKRYHGHGR